MRLQILNFYRDTLPFWYDYIKPKYRDRTKLCYTDTDTFVIHIKSEDFFEDIFNDAERWSDTSNHAEHDKRPLPIGKNKKVPGLLKDELGGKTITEVVTLRAKTYTYLVDAYDDDDDDEKKYGNRKESY